MKHLPSLFVELLVLFFIGLVTQHIFASENINHFYNKYLGFSLFFPLYALILSGFIYIFKPTNKFIILFMSIFLLALVISINIMLTPRGDVGRFYGAWAFFYVLPLMSFSLGLIYGSYKIFIHNKHSSEKATIVQTKPFKANNSKTIIPITLISVFMIFIMPYFICVDGVYQYGNLYIQITANYYLKIIICLISIIMGVGLIMRQKWMRWFMLFLAYYAVVIFAIILVQNSATYSLQLYTIVIFSIPFFIIYILNKEESLRFYRLDKTIRLKEISILTLIVIFLEQLSINFF